MAYDNPGGTGAIVRINRTLCTVCQCKGFSNDDAVTGILEILDNGRRYVPRKCRHELELIAAGIPEWVHERERVRMERKGGIVDGGSFEPTPVAEMIDGAIAGFEKVGDEWRIPATADVPAVPPVTGDQARVVEFIAATAQRFDGEGNPI